MLCLPKRLREILINLKYVGAAGAGVTLTLFF